MLKTLLSLGMALGLFVAGAAVAEQKIAVIDVVKVLNQSNANQKAEKELTAKRDKAQTQINTLEKPILDKQQRLRERRTAMPPEQFEEEQAKLRQEIREYRAQAQTIQEGLQREALKRRKEIADAVDSVVTTIAKAEGYSLVLPKNITVFSMDALDISDAVLADVNKKLK